MKNFKKIISLLLTAIMVFSTMAIAVHATEDPNGKYVQLTITTDKTGYGTFDTAKVTVKVENLTGETLHDVAVWAAGDNWSLKWLSDYNAIAVGDLAAHQSKEYTFKVVLNFRAAGVQWYNRVLLFLKNLVCWTKPYASYRENTLNQVTATKSLDQGGAIVKITAHAWYSAPATPIYTVAFDANGHGTAPASQYIKQGDKVTEPAALSEKNYTFKGWYKEDTCVNKWNFSTDTVTSNMTLFAGWELHTHDFDKTKWIYDGTNHWHVCKNCPARTDIEAHTWKVTSQTAAAISYKCDVCGATRELHFRDGLLVFGSYPQSELEDGEIIELLNQEASIPTAKWHSYNYYRGDGSDDNGSMTENDYMKYIDIKYDGAKYRGVKFAAGRPRTTGGVHENSEQVVNDYKPGTTYWFKFEPLTWKILNRDAGIVMCTSIIDSQPYANFITKKLKDGEFYNEHGVYASDWVTSSIREWLNDDFLNTAFTETEIKYYMAEKANSNKCWGTLVGYGPDVCGKYDSKDTNDKVSLLSYDEIVSTDLGFDSEYSAYDHARMVKGTDYAKCQGLFVYYGEGSDYNDYSYWWLRTPGYDSVFASNSACVVYNTGAPKVDPVLNNTTIGVRPVLCFPGMDGTPTT